MGREVLVEYLAPAVHSSFNAAAGLHIQVIVLGQLPQANRTLSLLPLPLV